MIFQRFTNRPKKYRDRELLLWIKIKGSKYYPVPEGMADVLELELGNAIFFSHNDIEVLPTPGAKIIGVVYGINLFAQDAMADQLEDIIIPLDEETELNLLVKVKNAVWSFGGMGRRHGPP